MASWLVLMAIKYLKWRGELDDEQVEAIRRSVQETM